MLDDWFIICYYQKVRVFKYTGFSRFAKKEGITDAELLEIVNLLEDDQADVSLGGDVYKVRAAKSGEGKSGGSRVIVYFKNEFRTFFVYGFLKSDRDNIDERELRAFKADAKEDFALTDAQINAWLKRGTLIEVFYGG
jgi:hypothetical protein